MNTNFTTRKALKAHLSRVVPEGEEKSLLEDARRELSDAQAEITALTKERTTLSREISVRQRKLADWKGKIPRGSIEPPTRALQRAGKMPWICIADMRGSCLTIRKPYRRAVEGLSGFSSIWIVTIRGDDEVHVGAYTMRAVDEKCGCIEFSQDHDIDGIVVDVKPYLSYSDEWKECDSTFQTENSTVPTATRTEQKQIEP